MPKITFSAGSLILEAAAVIKLVKFSAVKLQHVSAKCGLSYTRIAIVNFVPKQTVYCIARTSKQFRGSYGSRKTSGENVNS